MSQDAPQDKPSRSADTPGDGEAADRPEPPNAAEDDTGSATESTRRKPRWERRREKIREEIERNRRGEYTVPTWVLTLALVAIVVGWALLIILA